MAYAHSQDIIHLDLKPENIQTDSFGEVLVCDWGLGKIVSDDEDEVTSTSTVELLDNMTLIGEVKGSPGYMAPEQIESDGHKYHETVSKSKEEQIALARSLLTSVKGLKNRGIFDTPMKSIRQGLSLADHALVLDPDSEGVKYELFALNFICLNFKEALKYPLPKGHGRYGYMTLANAFPEFDYHRTKRPDTAKLSSFLSQAREIDPNHSAIIERIISYDAALRGSRDSYHPAILEFIKYLNPDTPDIELSKKSQEPEVILSTKESIKLIADPGGSEECVLRYLELRSLKIESSAEFDLSQLNGLTIRRLDLSTCPNFTVSKQVSLPFLERLIINPETSSSGELHHWIQGAKEFQIID